jgi:hypothetical protein
MARRGAGPVSGRIYAARLNPACRVADDGGMTGRCRYCGELSDDLASADDACPRCAPVSECGRCGHPRSAHVGLLRDGRTCAHVWVEQPAMLVTGCGCTGFAPARAGSLHEDLLLAVEARQSEASVPAAS